jgi:hypothetical protein
MRECIPLLLSKLNDMLVSEINFEHDRLIITSWSVALARESHTAIHVRCRSATHALDTISHPTYSESMSGQLLPDNQEDREVYLREHDAGNFIEAVRNTQTKQADTLIMMLDAFWGEPELLYVALNYARDQRRHGHNGATGQAQIIQRQGYATVTHFI